jgi:hypothetical protein
VKQQVPSSGHHLIIGRSGVCHTGGPTSDMDSFTITEVGSGRIVEHTITGGITHNMSQNFKITCV